MAHPNPEEEEHLSSSSAPSPPPFYKHFTSANLKALDDARTALIADTLHEGTDTVDQPNFTPQQLLALPTELRYLIPPAPPAADEEYTVFQTRTRWHGGDESQDVVGWISREVWSDEYAAGLLQGGWSFEKLYPDVEPGDQVSWTSLDRQNYLFRFLRSTLLAFVELLGILASNPAANVRTGPNETSLPEEKDEKLKDILTLVVNMHKLINEYRPHQARETLIHVMEDQVERKKAEIEGVRQIGEKIRKTLQGFETGMDVAGSGTNAIEEASPQEKKVQSDKEMWAALDNVLG